VNARMPDHPVTLFPAHQYGKPRDGADGADGRFPPIRSDGASGSVSDLRTLREWMLARAIHQHQCRAPPGFLGRSSRQDADTDTEPSGTRKACEIVPGMVRAMSATEPVSMARSGPVGMGNRCAA
jgi:hypothetical protein